LAGKLDDALGDETPEGVSAVLKENVRDVE